MYCQHCGKLIDNDSKYCIHCGKPTNDDEILTYDYTNGSETGVNNVEKHLFWWGLLYFFIFPLGLIAFFKYRGKKKKRSKLGLIMAWCGLIFYSLIILALFILDLLDIFKIFKF